MARGVVEIDQPSPELRVFQRDSPSEAPARGLVDRHGACGGEGVEKDRIAGHHPERASRDALGGQRLHEVRGAGDERRRTDRRAGVEAPQVRDARRTFIAARHARDESLEIVAARGVYDESPVDLRVARAGDHATDRGAGVAQHPLELRTDAAGVREDQPAATIDRWRERFLFPPRQLVDARRARSRHRRRLARHRCAARGVRERLQPELPATGDRGRHGDLAAVVRGVKGRPVERCALHVQARHAAEQRLPGVGVFLHRRQPGGRRFVFHALAAHAQEDSVRADLDIGGDLRRLQRAHARREAHRIHDVAQPVFGPRDLVAGNRRGHAAHQRNARRRETDLAHDALVLGEHRLHQRRMESVRHGERLRLHAGGFEPRRRPRPPRYRRQKSRLAPAR